MQTLNILAASPDSGRVLIGALADYDAELIHTSDGSYNVMVRLDGDHAETIAVLNALKRYVNAQATRAQVNLDGRDYLMYPEPAAQARPRY